MYMTFSQEKTNKKTALRISAVSEPNMRKSSAEIFKFQLKL